MITKTSIRRSNNNSKSATGAVNYLLSAKDSKGNIRSEAPKVIYGDKEVVKMYDKDPKISKTNKATSGVIALRDKEELNKDQRNKMLNRWIELTIPEKYRDNIDLLVVEHNDKSNTEYHYVIPHLTQDGKRFNPHAVIGRDRGQTAFKAAQAIDRIINFEMGFDQVQPGTGHRKGLSNGEFIAKQHSKKLPENQQKLIRNKEQITNYLHQKIRDGKISNKQELVNHLKQQNFQITRNGENYISIKKPEWPKAMRLQGGIYANGNTNAFEILKNGMAEKPKEYTAVDKARDLELVAKWHEILVDQFDNKRQDQNTLSKEFRNIERNDDKLELKLKPDIENTKKTDDKPTIIEQPQNQPINNVEGLGGEAISSGAGDAEGAANSAKSDWEELERLYGPNDNRVLAAKIKYKMAQAAADKAKESENDQQDNQRKRYKIK